VLVIASMKIGRNVHLVGLLYHKTHFSVISAANT
jgi:hypothetical protein